MTVSMTKKTPRPKRAQLNRADRPRLTSFLNSASMSAIANSPSRRALNQRRGENVTRWAGCASHRTFECEQGGRRMRASDDKHEPAVPKLALSGKKPLRKSNEGRETASKQEMLRKISPRQQLRPLFFPFPLAPPLIGLVEQSCIAGVGRYRRRARQDSAACVASSVPGNGEEARLFLLYLEDARGESDALLTSRASADSCRPRQAFRRRRCSAAVR
jgi:hypothetical protein